VLSQPLVSSHTRCGTGDIALLFLGALAIPVVFALATLAQLCFPFRVRGVHVATSWLAVLAAMVALVLCLWRVRRVAPDEYVGSLEEYPSDSAPWFRIRYDGRPTPEAPSGGCMLSLRQDAYDQSPADLRALQDFGAAHDDSLPGPSTRKLADRCDGIVVHLDRGNSVAVVEVPGDTFPGNTFALRRDGGIDPTDVRIDQVSSSLRPPTGWIASLGVGALLALGLALAAVVERRRAEAWRSAIPGTHRGEGWVVFDDHAPPIHFAAAAALPVGPVSVRMGAQPESGYRVHGGVDGSAWIASATLAVILVRAELRSTDLLALAKLVALVTLAPVAAAAAVGLLG
jgi:hypothetical protein